MGVKVTTDYGYIRVEECKETGCETLLPVVVGVFGFAITILVLSAGFGINDNTGVFAGVVTGMVAAAIAIVVLNNIPHKFYYRVYCGAEETRVYKTTNRDEDIKRVKLAIKEMELRMKQQYEQEKELRDELMKGVE